MALQFSTGRGASRLRVLVVASLAACNQPLLDAVALCGDDAQQPDTPTPDASGECRSIVIAGQSNARGTGFVSDLPANDPLVQPFADVGESVRLASSGQYPPVWTEYALSPTQPRVFGGAAKFGIELTLARDLAIARPEVQWRIAKIAMDSTSLAGDWNPANPASPNKFTIVHDWVASQTLDCPATAYVWIQGENDAATSGTANAYGANLAAFVAAVRSRIGAFAFVYGRLHANSQYAFSGGVRVGQESLSAANSHLVDQDSHALRADGVHYTTDSVIALGHAYAAAVLAATP